MQMNRYLVAIMKGDRKQCLIHSRNFEPITAIISYVREVLIQERAL